MPTQKIVTLYTYDELSDEAKEKARDWFRRGTEEIAFWTEHIYEDAANIAEMLGISIRKRAVPLMGGGTRYDPVIYYTGFSSQGDGACFEGTWRATEVQPGKVKEHAPGAEGLHEIAERFERIAKENPDGRFSVKHSGNCYHSGCTEFEFDAVSDDAPDALAEAARNFMDWVYCNLEEEYSYQNSDEVVAENILANEYTFLEDGTRED